MKIQRITPELLPKACALLRRAFPGSAYEETLVRQLHEHGTPTHDWVCLQTGKAIAYIAFTPAYRDREVCGLHLAPMAVAPEFQRQGVGSELLRFALRQEAIKDQPLFVLGHPAYYRKFGFVPCARPRCPFDPGNAHFLCRGYSGSDDFAIGYVSEFRTAKAASPPAPGRKKKPLSRGGRR